MPIQLVWLSHILDEYTPGYGGKNNHISITSIRAIANGDSCNETRLVMQSHTGSHVDAPYHFSIDGPSIDDYPPETWIFKRPRLVEIEVQPGILIHEAALPHPHDSDDEIDIVLLKTGFEQFRQTDAYWKDSPGIGIDAAQCIKSRYKNLRAIGMDIISASSLNHREEGRVVHRMLLSEGILLFEDLSLSGINSFFKLQKILAIPLRIRNGDGAPCTLIAMME